MLSCNFNAECEEQRDAKSSLESLKTIKQMTTWKIIISLCNKWFRFCFGFAFVILVCEDLLFLALQGVSQLCSNNSNNIIRVCILLYFEEMKNFTRPRHTICLLIWEVNLCLNLKKNVRVIVTMHKNSKQCFIFVSHHIFLFLCQSSLLFFQFIVFSSFYKYRKWSYTIIT